MRYGILSVTSLFLETLIAGVKQGDEKVLKQEGFISRELIQETILLSSLYFKLVSFLAYEPENSCTLSIFDDLEASVGEGGERVRYISKDLDWFIAIINDGRLKWTIILDLRMELLNVRIGLDLPHQL